MSIGSSEGPNVGGDAPASMSPGADRLYTPAVGPDIRDAGADVLRVKERLTGLMSTAVLIRSGGGRELDVRPR